MSKRIKVYDNKVFVTETKEIELKDENVQELRKKLRKELSEIVRQVKSLKFRAEEIQETLKTLEISSK